MPNAPAFPITAFYDGACVVCATEVEHYRRKDKEGRLTIVDISAADFEPERYGIPLSAFMHEMHVIDRQGRVYRGIEAFWAIWQAFPTSSVYGLMGILINLPLLNPLARLCYKGFARIRRYLPKRHRDCRSAACRIREKG
jgi:predicted DCC family thiol-disulfide oxidoreductase YuxK